MSYIVKDKYHKLTIKLKTKLQNYSNIYLDAYVKDSNNPYSLVPTVSDNDDGTKTLTFELRNKNYNIGTEFVSFKAVLRGTHKLIDLNEGVSILIDGNESMIREATITEGEGELTLDSQGKAIWTENLKTDAFATIFDDTEPHTIQAVYKGNDEIGVAFSDKIYVKPTQAVQMGHYTLTSTVPKTFKYMDTPKWNWTLKLNGNPVPNKVIETVLPNITYSPTTDNKGKVYQILPNLQLLAKWTPGTYTIIANFYHYNDPQDLDNKTLIQCKNKLTIVKNTPTLTYHNSKGKGHTFALTLRDPQGQAMPNCKISLKVNNKSYLKKTNADGNCFFKTNVKGRYKGTATFIGNNYYNNKTIKFDQVIR